MSIKIKIISAFLCLTLLQTTGCISYPHDHDTVYQVSTIDALLNGCYDGSISVDVLKKHGDTGIGTFNCLDGEMLLLDRVFYKIRSDGTVVVADDSDTTPFCAITYFENKRAFELKTGTKTADLTPALLGSPNYFYAIRITGKFKSLKARSVPKQSKPYPPLTDVVKSQPVFSFENIEGTAVGFYSPPFVKGVNVPGFHLHFISSDRTRGGHILDFEIEKANMQVDETHGLFMKLPDDAAFGKTDLGQDKEKDLKKVEK